MLEALRLPMRTPGWLSILVLSVGGWILLRVSGVFPVDFRVWVAGISLGFWLAVVGQLQCYGGFLLLSAVRGHSRPPAPPPEALNPFASFVAPVVLMFVWSAATLTRDALAGGNALLGIGAFAAIAVVPASVILMILGERIGDGLDPRRLAGFVRGLGVAYLALAIAFWIGYGGIFMVIWFADQRAFVGFLAAGYALLLAHDFAGRIVFSRRRELTLETERSPEQDVAAEVATEEAELKRVLFELHRLCSVDRYREAFQRLDTHLARQNYRNDPRAHELLQHFQGRPLALEHGFAYIERLLASGKALSAWDVCKRCLDEDELFRPRSDRSLMSLVSQSGHADASYAERLLADFARAYPDSTLGANATFRLAQIKIEHLDDRAGGVALLRAIRDEHARFSRLTAFRDYIGRLGID